MPTFTNNTNPGNEHAIVGVADKGIGVHGSSNTSTGTGGMSDSGIGVHGVSTAGPGVRGDAENGVGVFGGSKTSSGVGGMTDSGIGVHGVAKTGIGVRGDSEEWQGVYGHSSGNAGVVGESINLHGVFGMCHNPNGGGVFGTNDVGGSGVIGVSDSGIGVSGKGGRLAGRFEGDVEVTGDIRLANADCAEDFDVVSLDAVEPGTVMVLSEDGALKPSDHAYDKCVVGVVSGAGGYKPGIVLDKQPAQGNRSPIALVGKVYCKVDAGSAPVEIGDLLTTSAKPGHAMKATDASKSFGATIGKALRPLAEGQGLVPILIALQ